MTNRVSDIPDCIPVRNVIISVTNKSNLEILGDYLIRNGATLYSTGGTFTELKKISSKLNSNVKEISAYIKLQEMQGGLLKTLHHKLYAGILSEPFNQEHSKYLRMLEAVEFDLIVVNLYPFEEVLPKYRVRKNSVSTGIKLDKSDNSDIEKARSFIDIGGVTLLRAGAKNFHRVLVVTDPADYKPIIKEIEETGGVSFKTRFFSAQKSFSYTALYEQTIASYFNNISWQETLNQYNLHNK